MTICLSLVDGKLTLYSDKSGSRIYNTDLFPIDTIVHVVVIYDRPSTHDYYTKCKYYCNMGPNFIDRMNCLQITSVLYASSLCFYMADDQ